MNPMRTQIALIVGLCGCNPAVENTDTEQPFSFTEYGNEKPDNVEPTEGWSSQDDPTLFTHELVFNLDELPEEGEADTVPWPSSYWPVYKDSINEKWDGADSMSPAAKYGEAFGIADFEDLVSEHHGIDNQDDRTECESTSDCNSDIGESCGKREGEEKGYCIPKWWGICHAWAPVAILEPEPQQPVTVNDVEFKVNDIKALATLAYNRTKSRFVSLRCDEDDSEDEIEYDEYDRPTGEDEECRDTNPGTYHVLLANFLGIKGQSFVEDRTFDNEVWNQPLRGYNITKMEPIGVERAHELIGVPEDEEVTDTVGGTFGFSGNVAKDEWTHKGPYAVVEGAEVVIDMTGTEGDADLYVSFGQQPTKEAYDCRPYKPHSNESCSLTAGAEHPEVFVSVLGYSAAEFEVEVEVIDPDAPSDTDATEYEFNEDAEQFYHVKLEVKYMTESDSDTDGNLAHRVNSYTRTDRYQYVLEVDGDNNIIGGEWIGTSKKNHPDFLWLPTERSYWPKPAGGKLNWDLVKDLIDSSQIVEEPEVEAGASEITEEFTVEKGEWRSFGPFEVNGTLTATLTGDGDADLYARTGSAPTANDYDCRPYDSHSNEDCTVSANGAVYVGVNGYNESSVKLHIEFESEGGSTETPEESAHVNETGSVDTGEMALYVLDVSAGDKIRVETQSDTDVDLYVRLGNPPTTGDYDARGYTVSGDEKIDFDAHEAGVLHIGVHGWAASDYTVTTAER
jgi:hypothetical protein